MTYEALSADVNGKRRQGNPAMWLKCDGRRASYYPPNGQLRRLPALHSIYPYIRTCLDRPALDAQNGLPTRRNGAFRECLRGEARARAACKLHCAMSVLYKVVCKVVSDGMDCRRSGQTIGAGITFPDTEVFLTGHWQSPCHRRKSRPPYPVFQTS